MFKKMLILVCILGGLAAPLNAFGEDVIVVSRITGDKCTLVETYHAITGNVCYTLVNTRGEIRPQIHCIPSNDMSPMARGRLLELLEKKSSEKKDGKGL